MAALAGLLLGLSLLGGCASFAPRPVDAVPFLERAVVRQDGPVRVTAAVPDRKESRALFGVDLAGEDIQPVWLRIENGDGIPYTFLPIAVDPDYYSPNEAAWKSRFFWSGEANEAMAAWFEERALPVRDIAPGEAVEGFVFSQLDPGVKYFRVMLFHPGRSRSFDFVVEVPGLKADYHRVDFEALAASAEDGLDAAELVRRLDGLPCCVTGPDGRTPGDPLNIVVIGDAEEALMPFVQRGWHVTETVSGGAVWRTLLSSLFNVYYRTSPISSLYLFGRRQDVALQKARSSVDERNHLRLWLSPWRYRGMEVWVGQISRDIGVRLSSRTLVTHKIDPDVDEARDYLLSDLFLSGRLAAWGYRPGVGRAEREAPRFNYTRDPYHTDGQRLILLLAAEPVASDEVREIEWSRLAQDPGH